MVVEHERRGALVPNVRDVTRLLRRASTLDLRLIDLRLYHRLLDQVGVIGLELGRRAGQVCPIRATHTAPRTGSRTPAAPAP